MVCGFQPSPQMLRSASCPGNGAACSTRPTPSSRSLLSELLQVAVTQAQQRQGAWDEEDGEEGCELSGDEDCDMGELEGECDDDAGPRGRACSSRPVSIPLHRR